MKNKLGLTILSAFFLLFPTVTLAATDTTAPTVSIVDLPGYKNTDNFEVSYTALDAGGLNNVVLAFHKEGNDWSNVAAFTSTNGKFQFTASQITADARYYFRVTACDNSGNCSTDETSTTVDHQAPPAPESYWKEKVSGQKYRLHWHNPNNNGQAYTVYIYRSTTASFSADPSTLIATISVSPDTNSTYDNDLPDTNDGYYYALRNVDAAGNASAITADQSSSATTSPTGQPINGSQAIPGFTLSGSSAGVESDGTGGQVLGEGISPTSTPTQDLSQGISSTVADLNAPGFLTRYRWLLIVVTLAGLFIYSRRSKSKKK